MRARMSNDEVEGRSKHIKGQIREEVGKITDNKTEQLKGKIEQAEGHVQEEVGKIKRKAKNRAFALVRERERFLQSTNLIVFNFVLFFS
jgi:uncharacterized protein YjbJ (UPF0337 family)